LAGHPGAVPAVSFSPDGTKLVSVGGGLIGDFVRIWALDVDDLLEIAHRKLTRTWTDDECRQFLHLEACPTAA
jgi:WD40 repeat protein